jgi:hypothetical protein
MKLRGIFLTSERPELTANFYRDVFSIALEQVGSSSYVYWKIDDGQMQLAVHDAQSFAAYTYPPQTDSNLTHLYFKIDDQPAFLDHLKQQDIEPYAIDDIVVTILDPDGRKVMFGTA